jgi:hypothetical protein
VIVVDTSVWVDFLRNLHTAQTEWLDENLDDPDIGLTDLSFCEVLQGERTDASFEQVRRALLEFTVYSTGGTELAVESAAHYRFLRRHGVTIRTTVDCLIATFCIRQGHHLLHNDRDFDPFERHLGLKVIYP